jgi:hypothetical protein
MESSNKKIKYSRETSLTGIKDIDIEILKNLDAESLVNFCQINEAASEYCNNEILWEKWMKIHYSWLPKEYFYTWKNFALKTIYYVAKLKEEFNVDYSITYYPQYPKELYKSLINSRDYNVVGFEKWKY